MDSFECTFEQESKGGKQAKSYKFLVEFGLHCFTKGPSKHKGKILTDYPTELQYTDSREKRIFCFKRYELSKKLPDIAQGISQKPCYHTGKGNFFVIELINGKGAKEEYEVYFKISRERKGLLRLFVESAYVRDKEHNSSQPRKKKINFFVIAHNVQANNPIKAPK